MSRYMHHRFNTRKQLIKRLIAYFFMVSAIVIGVAGATVWIMGYRFDVDQQSVERISLVQFQTSPSGAQIYVNGNRMNFQTPGRSDNMRPGANTIEYKLDDYRDWSKTVNLKPAEVRWLNYARLVPNEIKSTPVAEFTGYHQALASPNGNWILLHQSPDDRLFKLIDISDPQNVRTTDFRIPDDALPGGGAETFQIIEWDSSSNYILLGREIDGQREIIRLDRRTPASSTNLTKLFGVMINTPHFLNNDNNIVFGLTDNNHLRRFEINSKTVSAPLVEGILNYSIYGDGKLGYSAIDRDGKQIAGIYYRDKNYVLKTYDEVQPTIVNFVHYYRTDYLAIARGVSMTIIENPLADSPASEILVDVPAGADWLTHNGSSRFIVVGRGDQLVSYDLETNEAFNFALTGLATKPHWIDDYHLRFMVDGNLAMIEFDGANQETLLRATSFGIFSTNNRFLFTFEPGDNIVRLNRSAMILE